MMREKKSYDWEGLVEKIQTEINANDGVIPKERLVDVQHYLDHDELGMAFEYLLLEIMENKNSNFTLGVREAREVALLFKLNDENECMVDPGFWPRFEIFLSQQPKPYE